MMNLESGNMKKGKKLKTFVFLINSLDQMNEQLQNDVHRLAGEFYNVLNFVWTDALFNP